jgi:hypothetical protein
MTQGIFPPPPTNAGMTLIEKKVLLNSPAPIFLDIPQSYKHLVLMWEDVYQSSATVSASVRLNNDTTAGRHNSFGWYSNAGTLTQTGSTNGTTFGTSVNDSPISYTTTAANAGATNGNGEMWIYHYSDSTIQKKVQWSGSGNARYPFIMRGVYYTRAAITRIDFIRNSTQSMSGTFYLYGVN